MSTPFNFSLSPLTIESASGPATEVLSAAQHRMGMIPNMYARMANAPMMLHTYAVGYEGFRSESGFSPAEQEVVFLTISNENGCDYCSAAHGFIAERMSGVSPEVIDGIAAGDELPDERLQVLHHFTKHLLGTHGRPEQAEVARFLESGFTEAQILYLVLAIAVKTISNYSNHMFDTPIDAAFSGAARTANAR